MRWVASKRRRRSESLLEMFRERCQARMLAEYDRSGMTGAQFARFVGVRYSSLMYWLQKRRKAVSRGEQTATPTQEHPRWLEARVEGEVGQSEKLVVEVGEWDSACWWATGRKRWRVLLESDGRGC